MQKIHVHNDFDVHLNFTNISTDYISRVEFWTRKDEIYCCCKCDGSLKVKDDNNIVCYLNDHNLGTGKLNYNVIFQIPDPNYNDGYKKVCQHYVSDIFLTSENGDTTVAIVKVLGDEEVTNLINRLSEFEKVFDNKQDKLQFDTTPTSGSKNVVYSDGIYNAIKNNKPDLTDYAKKSDLQGLATEQWVDDKGYLTEHQSLEGYVTETELNSKGYLTEHQSLTDYARKTDLQGLATEQWVDDKGYITSIPSDYITETELNSKGYLTEHQSLTDYARKTDLQGLATEQWVDDKGYLTEHQSLEGYVTETELNSKGYLTEHQSLDDYVKKSDLPSNTSIETVTVSPSADTEYTLNSNKYLRVIPSADVKLTFNRPDGTDLMKEYHIVIDCQKAVPTTDFKGVLWEFDNVPSFEKGKLYDIVIRDDGDNLYGSWKAYKLMPITILITTSDATAVQLNGTTYNLVTGDNSLTDSGFKTITDIGGFSTNITSIDFGGATIKIADLSNKFANMSNLTKISNITIKDATNFNSMFDDCEALTSLDVSNFNTSKVTNFSYMFYNCFSLTSLDVSNFNTSNGTDFSCMFLNCPSLTSLDLSNFNTSSATNFFAMFAGCSGLTALDVSKWDVSKGTNFSGMFGNCNSLTSLDVSGWNTSSATNFGAMFAGCSGLTALDVSNWNVSSATDFNYMFYNCKSLTSLDVSNWNVSSATNFSNMFDGCSGLTSLDVSKWDVSKGTNFSGMFGNCNSLTSLDVSKWDVSKATDFYRMFYNCNSLTTLDVSKWYVSKGTSFSNMFDGCSALTTLDLSGWNISASANVTDMLKNCNSLTTIRMVGCSQATIDKIKSVKPASATIITE